MRPQNQILIEGNLTADPTLDEVETADGKRAIVKFRLAQNPSKKNPDKRIFLNVTAWGEIARFLWEQFSDGRGPFKKGVRVLVQARLDYSEWTDGGDLRSMHSAIVERVYPIGQWQRGDDSERTQRSRSSRRSSKRETAVATATAHDTNDIPF